MCIHCENDKTWADALGHERSTEPCPRQQERLPSGHDAPVSNGPARHHVNADPAGSPAPEPRITHQF